MNLHAKLIGASKSAIEHQSYNRDHLNLIYRITSNFRRPLS